MRPFSAGGLRKDCGKAGSAKPLAIPLAIPSDGRAATEPGVVDPAHPVTSARRRAGRRAIPRGMEILRLSCATFWVDLRLREMNGRWLASADTTDGPSLGVGLGAMEAIEAALEPFHGIVDELMASLAD
jgi:hypothetical protein